MFMMVLSFWASCQEHQHTCFKKSMIDVALELTILSKNREILLDLMNRFKCIYICSIILNQNKSWNI